MPPVISLIKCTGSYLFFIVLVFLTLGLPLDIWWKVSLLTIVLVMAALTPLHLTLKKGLFAVVVCGSVMGGKTLIPLSYIEEGANVFVPTEPVFKQLPQPVYDHLTQKIQDLYPLFSISSDSQLYAFSVEQFHRKSFLSRQRTQVDFTSIHDARFGFMNKLHYNTYYDKQPSRLNLPFFVYYRLPQSLVQHQETHVCWTGTLFTPTKAGGYEKRFAPTRHCFATAPENINAFYGVSVDPQMPLALSIKTPVSQYIGRVLDKLLSLLGVVLLLSLFYPPQALYQILTEQREIRFKGMVLLGSLIFSLGVALLYRPHFASGFLLCEGGNDALSYASMARVVLEALNAADWKTALMGGEAVFDLMPLHRYTYALNLFLFGETHFGYFILVLFAPLSLYYLTRHLFNSASWAFALAMIFAVAPLFESFGFTQLYMVRLCMRGFAEPLSYMAFFTGIALGIPYLKTLVLQQTNRTRLILVGLCLAIAVGARPNVAPGAGIFLLCMSYYILRDLTGIKSLQQLTYLCLGFAPVLLIPLHNYVFGDVVVLFTVAGQKIENLAVSFQDYLLVFQGLSNGMIAQDALAKITTHLTTEIKVSQPWFYLVILLNIYGLLSKNLSKTGKVVAFTGLSQLSIVLFYNVGGRYGYLHWSLLLLTALLVLKTRLERR